MANFKPVQYANKIIMAPMVKIGTLPTRLLAIRYGADLVYTEEIIDWKLLKAKRVVNESLGTIDFVDESEGVVAFRTCDEEKSKVVIQIGTADADRALKVAQLVQNDVAGIDINMGCPKEFSIKGGMGAALLKQPEKIKTILTTLCSAVNIPVTCKIRVLSSLEETVKLAEMIQSCGVSAIAVHGRTKDERQQHVNRNDYIRAVAEKLNIPVIANGGSRDIENYKDILKFKEKTGCSSVMLARAAEWNPSIFRKEGKEDDIQVIITEYIKLAIQYDNPFPVSKYTMQNMLRELQETPLGKQFLASNVMDDLSELWGLGKLYTQLHVPATDATKTPATDSEDSPSNKRPKLDASNSGRSSNPPIIIPGCAFIRGHYPDVDKLPKSIVLVWFKKNGFGKHPDYTTESKDKKFRSTVCIGGQGFMTDVWEKNKRYAEQGAALAFIKHMKL